MATIDFHTLTTEKAEADISLAAGEMLEMVELYLVDDGMEMYMGDMMEVSQSGNTHTYRYTFFDEEAASGETYKVVISWSTWNTTSSDNSIP